MYRWITHTWNPLGGSCPHKCVYCSTKSLVGRYGALRAKYTGKPYLVKKEMSTRLGKDNIIFVCNMTDLFAVGVSSKIIQAIFAHCRAFPKNTYLFQTKNPARFLDFALEDYPPQMILCTTIETNIKFGGISEAPIPRFRADAMIEVKKRFPEAKISVTIEPILDFWEFQFPDMLKQIKPDFVSIGADSKNSGLPEPTEEQLQKLVKVLERAKIRVIKKENLERLAKYTWGILF